MVAVMIALMWRYLLWRWLATLPPVGLTSTSIVGLIFVTVETLAIVGSTISLVFLARLSDRSPDADRNAAWLEAQRPLPLVDVFICTYNEEEAILERTIVGALSMDYARYRVWVLDDGRRPWLRGAVRAPGLGLPHPARQRACQGRQHQQRACCTSRAWPSRPISSAFSMPISCRCRSSCAAR